MKYTTINLLGRVSIYAKDYWQHIVGIFLLNLLATPIALLKPLALKIVIDNGFGSQPLPAFIQMFFPLNYSFTFEVIVLIAVALVLVVALIDNINGVAMWLLETYTGEKMVLNLRTLLFNHIQRLSLAYHDRKGVSYSLYRMQWDTMSIRGLLIDNLSPIVSSFMTLISMIIIMFYINWSLALTALCVIPPLYILIRLSTSRLKKDWDTVKDDESQAMSLVHEVLGALRIVKAFGQEKNEGDRSGTSPGGSAS